MAGRYKPYPEYKDSGVEWLAEMPAHWALYPSKRLFPESKVRADLEDEQLSATQDYGVISQERFMKLAGRRVVQLNSNQELRKRVDVGDFVISMRSFQGGLERAWEAGGIRSSYVVLKPVEQIERGYFQYLFKSSRYIQALQSTANFIRDGQDMNYQNFVLIDLPCPSQPEQEQIANFLDHETAKIDTLIEKQQQLIALLKEKRQAVISHAVTKGLNPNAKMKDSGVEWLGEVPEGWGVKKLKHLLKNPLMYGANEAALEADIQMPRFIRITDVCDDGTLRDDTFRSLNDALAAPYLLSDGDVLLARTGGTVGKSFKYSESWGRCCFAGYLIKASLNQEAVLADWFYQYTQTKYYWEWIASSQIQATLPNVSADKYNGFILAIPSLSEQRIILATLEKWVGAIDQLIANAQAAIELIQERRSALISAAVTGKIDVRDWVPPVQDQISREVAA